MKQKRQPEGLPIHGVTLETALYTSLSHSLDLLINIPSSYESVKQIIRRTVRQL